MTYILKSLKEGSRLDQQTEMEEFSLEKELRGISFNPEDKVLDAGCGSGVLCRYLESNFPNITISGCDLSESSLVYAREKSMLRNTKYFRHNLVEDALPEKYEVIFNRLVAHHLGVNLPAVLGHFFQGLKPGGSLYIIDTDGLFLNLATLSSSLQEKIEAVRSAFPGNLNAGRMIPGLLHNIGFKKVDWRIEVMDFHGPSRQKEVEQWKERFDSSMNFYIDLFGSEFEARKFFKEYTSEAANEHIPMFYNKFIIKAQK